MYIILGWIGTSFGISFLQNRKFCQQASGFREGTCHLFVQNDIRCRPRDFHYRGNIELYECPVKFWNYFGFVWPFLYINWVYGHLMCIIQIWTTSTCSHAPKLVENRMCVLEWISRSHARNGNEIQSSGHRGSAEYIEKLGFKILVNPKHT